VSGRARKVRVPAKALAPVRVLAVVRADHLGAVRLAARAALVARAARVRLRADADAVADLDVRDGAADAQRDADDLVAHDLRVHGRAPPAAERVQVCTKEKKKSAPGGAAYRAGLLTTAANAAVRDGELDGVVRERLGLVLGVLEVADRVLVLADPAGEPRRRGGELSSGGGAHFR
jgi:hypothetical protein